MSKPPPFAVHLRHCMLRTDHLTDISLSIHGVRLSIQMLTTAVLRVPISFALTRYKKGTQERALSSVQPANSSICPPPKRCPRLKCEVSRFNTSRTPGSQSCRGLVSLKHHNKSDRLTVMAVCELLKHSRAVEAAEIHICHNPWA
jgi:hypothetical protein